MVQLPIIYLRQFGPRRRAGEQRRVSGRPLLRACGQPILRRANDQIDASRPTGEATVNVALAVADHHHRRRIRRQGAGSFDPSQPAHALLVLNRPLAPQQRFDGVLTGPDLRVQRAGTASVSLSMATGDG